MASFLSVRNEASVVQKNRPAKAPWYTCTPCCGIKMGLRDVVMFGVIGGSLFCSAIAFEESHELSMGMLAVGALGCVVQFFWRRDAAVADLHRIVVNIQNTNREMAQTTKKTEDVVSNLHIEDQLLKKENEELLQVKNQFAQSKLQLSSQLERLERSNASLLNENRIASRNNAELNLKISWLQESIKVIKQNVSRFDLQNQTFEALQKKLTEKVHEFGEQDAVLSGVLHEVDETLSREISELAEQVRLSQQISCDAQAQLLNQNNALKEQISQLQAFIAQLNQDRDGIESGAERLEKTQKKISDTERDLGHSTERLRKTSIDLTSFGTTLHDTAQKIEKSEREILFNAEHLRRTVTDLGSITRELGKQIDLENDEWIQIAQKTTEQENRNNLQG